MNDSQSFEAEPVRLGKILFDNELHVTRGNGVEIEDIGDGDAQSSG